METYKQMLQSRPQIDEVTWQREALLDKDILTKKKVVVAAGTSSGKSLFMTMLLEQFYLNEDNKTKQSLFIPSGQTNLRLNIQDTFEFFKPTFSYVIAENCDELQAAIDNGTQVIVCLPQSVARCMDSLNKLDKFILDEAHTWYFQKTIKNIIKKTKPEQQLLLTGTPAPFILRGGFHMHFVPVMDLYNEGRISNTEVHVVASNYDFKNSDYNVNDNLSLDSRTKMALASEDSFRKVILGMIKKLKNPIKGLKNVNRLTNDIAGQFFKHLDKTIIWANSIQQANKFAEVLRTFNGLENAVLLSHSKNDDDSELMEKFKNDKDIRALVTVNRGRMGWSYTELFNAVDFTMTRNLSSILQMMARLFRISKTKPNQKKIFYKVSNAKDAGYYTVIMKGVLLLLDREWYSKFNGKNFNGMEIPVTVPRRKVITPDGNKVPGRKKTNYKYEMLDLPLDMNFFKTVYAKQDDEFSTIAWTTIGEVRKKLFNLSRVQINDKQTAKEITSKYNSFSEFAKDNPRLYEYIRQNKYEKECYTHMKDYQWRLFKDDKEFIKKELSKSKYYKLSYVEIVKMDTEYGVKAHSFYTQGKLLGLDVKKIVGMYDPTDMESRIARAKKYKSYNDFQKKNQVDYQWFLKTGNKKLMHSIFDFSYKMPTLEERINRMKEYSDFSEWRKVNKNDYSFLTLGRHKEKYINTVADHFNRPEMKIQ
jgi:hypothetical protein